MRRVNKSFVPIDGDALLYELQHPETEQSSQEPEQNIIIPIPTADMRRRQSLMDNPKNLYICDTRSGIVHDKECNLVAQIPDVCFIAMQKLPRDIDRICRTCYRKALIRTSIGNDRKHMDGYLYFFNNVSFSNRALYRLFIKNKTSLFEVSKNNIKLKVNVDKWMLIKNNGILELWHNNYYICEDFSRVMSDTYHKQAQYRLNDEQGGKVLTDIMCDYSWEEHRKKMIAKKKRLELHEKLNREWQGKTNYFVDKHGIFRSKILYFDINNESEELFVEAEIKVRQLYEQRSGMHLNYPLRCCKVRRKDLEKFKSVMNELKKMSFCEKYQDYVYIIKKYMQ